MAVESESSTAEHWALKMVVYLAVMTAGKMAAQRGSSKVAMMAAWRAVSTAGQLALSMVD